MKNIYLLFSALFILLYTHNAVGQKQKDLPKWMTEHEKEIMDDYLRSFKNRGLTTPPPYSNIRTAAEWEEVQALVITWTGSFNSIQSQIVDAAQDECLVIIHCSDSNNVKSALSSNGVPDVNVDFIETNWNTIWIRDYGANTCYVNDVDSLFLVDWMYNRPRPDDDVIPDEYAAHLGLDLYSMTSAPNDVMATGGNFMADGAGTAFSSHLITDENDGSGPYSLAYPNHTESQLNQLYNDWMGINTYIKMTVLPYDDIHHIDMHMKLLDEETLLVGEYPDGVSDGPQIEANLQYVLDNFTTKFGTPFKVYRIPQPSSPGGSYPDGSWGSAYYRTYANQTFVNNTVLLPTYREEYDTTALAILDTIMPGYNIVPIDVDDNENLISLGGAIHCITHTVGVSAPIYITHKKLENTSDDLNPYQATAEIKHKDGIASASIFYKTDLSANYTEVPLTNTTGDDWSGLIPAQSAGTMVYYYIEGTANGGKQTTHPMPAPNGYHKFKVTSSSSAGIAEENPLKIKDIYPNPASAITVIPVHSNHTVNGRIVVKNMIGETVEVVHDGIIPQGDKNYFIDATTYASGMYQVMIISEDYKSYKKLIVK